MGGGHTESETTEVVALEWSGHSGRVCRECQCSGWELGRDRRKLEIAAQNFDRGDELQWGWVSLGNDDSGLQWVRWTSYDAVEDPD